MWTKIIRISLQKTTMSLFQFECVISSQVLFKITKHRGEIQFLVYVLFTILLLACSTPHSIQRSQPSRLELLNGRLGMPKKKCQVQVNSTKLKKCAISSLLYLQPCDLQTNLLSPLSSSNDLLAHLTTG